ncbi:MAG: HAMP domain-containing protein [Acidobacteria bacterium]|nr:HAMP domain-containing protein [Acidobacteriota bacterium]
MKSPGIKSRKKLGLRAKFILAAFVIQVAVIAIAGYATARGELEAVEEAMKNFYLSFAKSSAELCKDAVWSRDVLFLDDYVEAAKRDENILYLIIEDRGGVVLASSDRQQIGKKLTDMIGQRANETKGELIQEIEASSSFFDQWMFNPETCRFDVAVPIAYLRGAEKVGLLRVGFAIKNMGPQIVASVRALVLMIVAVFAVGMFIGLWVDVKLRRNVHQLISVTGQMADGDLSQRVDIKTADELEQLGNSFNKMAERLRERETENQQMQAQISQYAAELERRVAERTQELEEEKRRLDGIVGAVGAGLALLDQRKQILWANKTLEAWCGSLERIAGSACYRTFWGEEVMCVNCPSERAFKMGGVAQGEKVLSRDGATRYVQITSSPIKDAEGNVVEVVELIQDITDQKQMEAQLIQTAKLAAVGELAGGVAHEINNPTGIILAKAKLLLSNLGDQLPAKVITDLEKIGKHAERVATIARGLLTFSRQSVGERIFVNMNTIITEALSLVEHRLSVENIRATMRLRPDLPTIKGNPNELQQVIINIVNNAIDAMPGGGELTITTDVTSVIEAEGLARSYVTVAIHDTGVGIPVADRGKIFDPFFTTKEVGKGTGLGLSISHGIVKSHGGDILAESRSVKGTTFTVKLPCGNSAQGVSRS